MHDGEGYNGYLLGQSGPSDLTCAKAPAVFSPLLLHLRYKCQSSEKGKQRLSITTNTVLSARVPQKGLGGFGVRGRIAALHRALFPQ